MATAKPASKKLMGLIPAAGLGSRARPHTHKTHKGLFNINGRTNLERIVELMRDALGIEEIVVIVGHLGETVQEHLGDGERFGVSIIYIDNNRLERGWAWSVLLAKRVIDTHFAVMLCDECYTSSNHADLLRVRYKSYLAVCTGIQVDDVALIKKNYSIEHKGRKITSLVEKPETASNNIMGSGTFIFSPDIFEVLETKFAQTGYESFNLVDQLNDQIQAGQKIGFFELQGHYVNINDRDSLYLAKYHDRIAHFDEYKISLLVCPVGDEHDICFTVNRYRDLGVFDRILVSLPAINELQEELDQHDIEYVVCPAARMRFGERMRYGLSKLDTDIYIFTEADYSFSTRDVDKLISYLKEADLVVGTRTTRQLVQQGSTMRGIVRFAHSALGRLIQLLWWSRESRLTDVGCTFRGIWASSYKQMLPNLNSQGPEFLSEMVIESLHNRQRVLEIPVNYYNRSESLNSRHRNSKTFFQILSFILIRRAKLLYEHGLELLGVEGHIKKRRI